MINTIAQVLRIKTEKELGEEFEKFEAGLFDIFKPLQDKLAQQVLTSEVPQLELHMTFVESWRDRVTRYHALSAAWVEHVKSTHFILPGGKGITQVEKEAYQKKLAAGFIGARLYTEELIRSVDSRVNLCKKLLGLEGDGLNSGLRR